MNKVGKDNHSGHSMPAMNKGNARALKITAWLTGVYFIIELGLGIYSGSISVISDAFHTFSAVGGVLLALVAGKISMRPADKSKSFGSFRAEIIGALFNGLFLFLMAILVLYMGFKRLLNPIELPLGPMFLAAFGGLITEAISIKLLFSGQKGNLNMKGAFWHVMQTFIGSIIIIISALVIWITGFLAIDPILGMLFGLVLFYASYGIIKDSLNILLEQTPKEVDLDEIKKTLKSISGVKNIHHIHAWTLTSGKNIFSAHLQVKNISKGNEILKKANEILKKKFNFYFSTIQIEDKCIDYEGAKDIDIDKTKDFIKVKIKNQKEAKNRSSKPLHYRSNAIY